LESSNFGDTAGREALKGFPVSRSRGWFAVHRGSNVEQHATGEIMPLEDLRIVRETAECLRARPESAAALRRRNEWIRSASSHHSLNEVARAARLLPQEVDVVLQGAARDSDAGLERTAGLRTIFRSSPA
jgi:hypothetical protein